jgi:antirestriction protein ArdC
MPTQQQIRQEITKRIIEALENGVKPWRRPWNVSPNSGRPSNVVSRKLYQGINPLLLELHSHRFGLRSKWWGTFRQWSDMGCTVKKRPADVEPGHWGASIILYRPFKKTVENDDGDQEEHEFMLMRTFTVFSADQVEGKAAEKFQVKDEPANGNILPDYQPAEELIVATGADIRYGGDRAYYTRPVPEGSWPDHQNGDFVCLPPKHRFNPVNAFYETVLHELAHFSEVRTGWDHKKQGYAMGELAAEIAASYLSTELGIPQNEALENHAAYLQSWLKEMRDDPSYIFKASTQASRAADYLLSFVRKEEAVVAIA